MMEYRGDVVYNTYIRVCAYVSICWKTITFVPVQRIPRRIWMTNDV